LSKRLCLLWKKGLIYQSNSRTEFEFPPQVILQDGREIYSSLSRFSFRHGWEYEGHTYRVEINEVRDLFTIDTVPFEDFEPMPKVSSRMEDKPSPEKDSIDLKMESKSEHSTVSHQTSSVAFDPFASPTEDKKPMMTSSEDLFSSFTSDPQPKPSSTALHFDLFTLDSFDQQREQPQQRPTSAFNLFNDEFNSQASNPSHPSQAPSSPFDLFPNSTMSGNSKSETFSPPSAAATPVVQSVSPFDLFESMPSKSPQVFPPGPSHPSPSFDPFASLDISAPAPPSDPFNSWSPQAIALNPFETDCYPSLTSSPSGPDPFFS
jgi:hypothetical protein